MVQLCASHSRVLEDRYTTSSSSSLTLLRETCPKVALFHTWLWIQTCREASWMILAPVGHIFWLNKRGRPSWLFLLFCGKQTLNMSAFGSQGNPSSVVLVVLVPSCSFAKLCSSLWCSSAGCSNSAAFNFHLCRVNWASLKILVAFSFCFWVCCTVGASVILLRQFSAVWGLVQLKKDGPSFCHINNIGAVEGPMLCHLAVHARWRVLTISLLRVEHSKWGLTSLPVIAVVSLILLMSVILFNDWISSRPESQRFCQLVKDPVFPRWVCSY